MIGSWFRVLLPITIFVTFAAIPAPVPEVIYIGGLSFQLYEPLLVVTAALAIPLKPVRSVVHYVAPYSILCVLVTVVAIEKGGDLSKVGSDVRLPLYVAVSMFIASKVIGTQFQRGAVRASFFTLWFSAAMVILASFEVVKVSGRSEAASLDLNQTDAATRFLTPMTFPAVVIAGVCLVFVISGNRRDFRVMPWFFPAAVLMLLAFSRNHLVALAAALGFALIAFRSARSLVATGRVAVILAVIVTLFQLGIGTLLSPLPGAAFVDKQANSYFSRVIDGLKTENRTADPSVIFRQKEMALMKEAIEAKPIQGHGFGYAYKGPVGEPGTFAHDQAPYYAHNFYMWFLMKVGIIGMLTFIWMAAIPLIPVLLRPHSVLQVAIGAAAFSMLVIAALAPIPNDTPGSPLLGALLGVLVTLTPRRDSSADANSEIADAGSSTEVSEPRAAIA